MRTRITRYEADNLNESLQRYLMRKFGISIPQDDLEEIIGDAFEIAESPVGRDLSMEEDWGEPFDGIV